jgi:hypothetical protein
MDKRPAASKKISPMQPRPFGSEFTRKMWSDMDHILLVYVGSAAEFALVEENHWLFYTNALPAAPWDRFVSTFAWNKRILLSSADDAPALARKIRGFHDPVEQKRSDEEGGPRRISNEAFKAVGAMLIEYALLAEAYLERRELSPDETETHYQDQRRFFSDMGIVELEPSYADFSVARTEKMPAQLRRNAHTDPLFSAYRRELGSLRYGLLLQFMAHFVPEHVVQELGLRRSALFTPFYRLYPRLRCPPLSALLHRLLLPARVRKGLAA